MWSRYNYFFQKHSRFFLYNSLSNSFAELSAETYNELYYKKSIGATEIEDPKLKDNLKSMKVFVDSDTDEINKIKYLTLCRRFNRKTLVLTINPTLDCNFNCPYCFEGQHPYIYMTDKVEEELIQYIKKLPDINHIDITWFGGEPLLAFKRIISLTEKVRNLNIGFEANMITNGYLLNQSVIEKLEDLHIRKIQITIDGLEVLHDSRRCLRNGGKTYAKILNNIDLLQKIRPNIYVGIRVNIDVNNQDEFVQLYTYFKSKKYPNLYIYPAFVDNDTECQSDNNLFDSKMKAKYLLDLQQKYHIDFNYFYPNGNRAECAIRNANTIVVGPEGEIYKCWNDVGNAAKIIGYLNGKITNETLLLRYLTGADPFDDAKCKECLLLPVCGGGCPYVRLKNLHNKQGANTCDLLKDNMDDFLYSHYMNKLA